MKHHMNHNNVLTLGLTYYEDDITINRLKKMLVVLRDDNLVPHQGHEVGMIKSILEVLEYMGDDVEDF